MPSNEYLQQVTTGEVEELNGEIVRCEYDESWAKSVQGLCAKPILVIILFSAKRDKYASCEKNLAQNTWKYVQNYADAKS